MYNDFTIVGDPHATPKSLEKINQLTATVESLRLPTIWLGDLLDTKEIIRGKCQNTWIDYFEDSKLEHIIVVGNHDYFNLECEDHSARALKLLPNVTVVDQPTSWFGMTFLPYIHDQDKLKDLLKRQSKDTALFGHFEIKSFDFGNGHICETGITTRSLSKFKRVISGHFHKFQQKGNLTYLGTPFSHTFGEANQEKFLGKYSRAEDKLELIPTNFPKHISIDINCDENQGSFDAGNGENYVRLILIGSQDNIDIVKANNTFHDSVKVLERSTDEFNNNVSIDETANNLTQFNTWASDIQQLDEETIKLGLQILGAVNGR